jgi:TP53 regulating kinase-like protein
MEKIGDGAEAIIYRQGITAIKTRLRKGYRIKEIDERLRKTRTRREAKLTGKIARLGFGPALIGSDETTMKLQLEFLDGSKLRDVLCKKNQKRLSSQIGERVAELHNNGIIHSDLTTSNMMLVDGRLYLIDFGLSYESSKAEDKAVDLHLLRQALESKHHELWEQAFKEILTSYKRHAKDSETIIQRLDAVEKRGRNKGKGS